MSFYVYDRDLGAPSLLSIVNSAAHGDIADAVRAWQHHQSATDGCVCGRAAFDPVCCGFCLTGKLLHLGLLHPAMSQGVDHLKTAHAVSAYVGRHNNVTAAQGGTFYDQPNAA